MLTEDELAEIRNRKEDLLKYHNILVAQNDVRRLLRHIDHQASLLEVSEREQARLRRSLE